jgi:DNA-binding transcriptional ArsR family regulator
MLSLKRLLLQYYLYSSPVRIWEKSFSNVTTIIVTPDLSGSLVEQSRLSSNNADGEFRRLLWFLLGGSRGGENRAKILSAIKSRPCNLNQLAKLIDVDYRSVQHHMSVLQKNNLVLSAGQKYGMVYSTHPYLDYHFHVFEQICVELGYALSLNLIIAKTKDRSGARNKTESFMPPAGPAGGALHL